MIKNLFIISIGVTLLSSCLQKISHSNLESETKTILSNFGHLNNVNKYETSSLFLSTLKKDQKYRICLSENLTKKYPGIQSEVEAAVNIWAHYIDRKIPIEITIKKLPFPEKDWKMNDFKFVYSAICGQSDLYLGEDHPFGTRLGYTKESLSYFPNNSGHDEISSFIRVLNLTSWPSNATKKFISLEQATNKKRNTQEIFDLLVSRQQQIYLPEDETYLTLKTLVHEFGHVWGLCDQYPLEGGRTNCDPSHSTLSPDGHIILEQDSMMGGADWITELGLHDDDIIGIIDLAQRSDIAKSGWDLPSKQLNDFPNHVKNTDSLKYIHINSIKDNGGGIVINAALDISGPSKIMAQIKYLGQSNWPNGGPKFEFSKDISSRNVSFKISGIDINRIDQVRLIYLPNGHQGLVNSSELPEKNISNIISPKMVQENSVINLPSLHGQDSQEDHDDSDDSFENEDQNNSNNDDGQFGTNDDDDQDDIFDEENIPTLDNISPLSR